MKKADVKVGGVYAAKVSGKVVPVRIDAENPQGGWDATNTVTKKKVRIKSAQRLRGPWPKKGAKGDATGKAAAKDATRAKRGGEGAKRPSLLDAAALVLAGTDGPMNCKQMVEAILERRLWQTKGATPASTLHSALSRQIAKRGKDGRFRKVGRGTFALAK